MKPCSIFLALTAALPHLVTAKDPCKDTLNYCGSTLISYNGYTAADLRAVVPGTFLNIFSVAAYDDPRNTLFQCVGTGGGVKVAEYCSAGCTGSNNGDGCAPE
ncbi:hypothetical protein BJY04DRAFT_224736 [Aspergillus karnatakaensis]|uniref:uncharacterized protein n=1 Tax=Aspergillus karnatakaensis TaxID=1810916 RepID=UPI003CCD7AE9